MPLPGKAARSRVRTGQCCARGAPRPTTRTTLLQVQLDMHQRRSRPPKRLGGILSAGFTRTPRSVSYHSRGRAEDRQPPTASRHPDIHSLLSNLKSSSVRRGTGVHERVRRTGRPAQPPPGDRGRGEDCRCRSTTGFTRCGTPPPSGGSSRASTSRPSPIFSDTRASRSRATSTDRPATKRRGGAVDGWNRALGL